MSPTPLALATLEVARVSRWVELVEALDFRILTAAAGEPFVLLPADAT